MVKEPSLLKQKKKKVTDYVDGFYTTTGLTNKWAFCLAKEIAFTVIGK